MSPKTRQEVGLWSNPFSTHHVRPGEIEFFLPTSSPRPLSLGDLMDQLQRSGWHGQIVGPHGTGKTTLLRTLALYWQYANREPVTVQLRDGQTRMPRLDWGSFGRQTQLIVDGYEQLSWSAKVQLKARCRRHQAGLLVTSHQRQAGLSVLHETETCLELAHELTRELIHRTAPPAHRDALERFLLDTPTSDNAPSVVATRYAQCHGNIRETLMALYDDAESFYWA